MISLGSHIPGGSIPEHAHPHIGLFGHQVMSDPHCKIVSPTKTKGKMKDYTTYTVNFSGVTFITATSIEQVHSIMEQELAQVASSWEFEVTE